MRNRPLLYAKGLENKKKYLKAPSCEQIYSFIKELGVSVSQFERFYGIPYQAIYKIKRGEQDLGAAYWHFVYEKIKPAYGTGYVEDYQKVLERKIKKYKSPQKKFQDINNERLKILSSK